MRFSSEGRVSRGREKLNDATSQALDTPRRKGRLHELALRCCARAQVAEYLAKFVVVKSQGGKDDQANGLQVD
jgi:hypothetical protein